MDVSLCITPVGQIMIQIRNVRFVAFEYSIVSLRIALECVTPPLN